MVPWAGGGAGVRGRGDRVTVVRGRCVTGEGRGEGSCEGVESGVDLTVGRAVELGVEILRGSSSASSVTAQTHNTIIHYVLCIQPQPRVYVPHGIVTTYYALLSYCTVSTTRFIMYMYIHT